MWRELCQIKWSESQGGRKHRELRPFRQTADKLCRSLHSLRAHIDAGRLPMTGYPPTALRSNNKPASSQRAIVRTLGDGSLAIMASGGVSTELTLLSLRILVSCRDHPLTEQAFGTERSDTSDKALPHLGFLHHISVLAGNWLQSPGLVIKIWGSIIHRSSPSAFLAREAQRRPFTVRA